MPKNPAIRQNHLQCGYFEGMRSRDVVDTSNWKKVDKKFNKSGAYLRTHIRSNWGSDFTLKDTSGKTLGTISAEQVFRELHKGAIFKYNGKWYKRIAVNYEEQTATIQFLESPKYRTSPIIEIQLEKVYKVQKEKVLGSGNKEIRIGYGDIKINYLIIGYLRSNILDGDIRRTDISENPNKRTLKTTGAWISFPPDKCKEFFPGKSDNDIFIAIHGLEHLLLREFVDDGHCDWSDFLGGSFSSHHLFDENPAIVFFDNFRKGLGLSEEFYNKSQSLLSNAGYRIANCPCDSGCPSCILSKGYCEYRNENLDKTLTREFLDQVIQLQLTKKQYPLLSPAAGNQGKFPPVVREQYSIGDKYNDEFNVIGITDNEIVIMNKDGDIEFIPYKDID